MVAQTVLEVFNGKVLMVRFFSAMVARAKFEHVSISNY